MKRILSLILAVSMIFCFCVVPVAAEGEPTAKITASLKGDTVPQAGEKFYVAFDISGISSGYFVNGQVEIEWPVEVASLARHAGTSTAAATNPALAIGGFTNKFSSDTFEGKWSATNSLDVETGKGYVGTYINIDAEDQAADEVTERTMFEVAFVLNADQSYDDFYVNILSGKAYLTADKKVESSTANGAVTVESKISKKEEVIYSGSAGQDANAIFDLPTVISGTADVTYTFNTVNAKDSIIGLNNKAQMEGSGNYFASSSAYLAMSATELFYHDGSGKIKMGNITTPGTYNVTASVDAINKTWSASVADAEGNVVGSFENKSFRNKNIDVLDCLVVLDNAGGGAGAVTVTNLVITDTTPASMGTLTFKYVCGGVELGTAPKTAEIGTEVSVEATTLTVDGVKYDAPAAAATIEEDGQVVEVECVKYETVTVNYVVGDAVAKTATATGLPGSTVAFEAVQLAYEGAIYTADAVEFTVAVGGNTETVELVVTENVVVASKTETWNATAGAVYPYPTGRVQALEGTDVMYSASWGDLRYGEAVFPVAVGADEKVSALTVTYTAADSMSGHPQDVAIYVADAATYGTTNDLATLTQVGTFSFGTNNETAYTVELDLTNVVITDVEEIMLIVKVTSGLGALYGASFEQAPYVVYELEAYEPETEATEPETEATEPETEATEPETEATEPETEATEPETEATEPETEATEPETEATEPETEATEPETEATEPETEATEPETEATEPETDPTEPSEPEGEELPFEAVDVVITPSALGVTVTGKFVDEDTTYDTVVVVISYLKDGKAYSVQAVEVPVINGEVEIPASNVTLTEGELSVAGISVLVGVDALSAITTGNLGTPVGSYK